MKTSNTFVVFLCNSGNRTSGSAENNEKKIVIFIFLDFLWINNMIWAIIFSVCHALPLPLWVTPTAPFKDKVLKFWLPESFRPLDALHTQNSESLGKGKANFTLEQICQHFWLLFWGPGTKKTNSELRNLTS
jgi:hypothetical protein